MELRRLRYFIAVAEERHFGRAAARLHMAQPPLSQQIRALETELGVRLFRRTTRRVELTEAGAAYLALTRPILAAVAEAGQEARRIATGSVGRLALGFVGSATYSLLPELARALAQALPSVELVFRGEMLVPAQVDALRSGDIDLALLRTPIDDLGITTSLLRHDRLVVALPAEHDLAHRPGLHADDLRDQVLIAHSERRGSVMHETVTRLCQGAGFEPHFGYHVDETSTLIALVASGLGLAVVPEPIGALAFPGVRLLPLWPVVSVELAIGHLAERTEPRLLLAADVVRRQFSTIDAELATTGGALLGQ